MKNRNPKPKPKAHPKAQTKQKPKPDLNQSQNQSSNSITNAKNPPKPISDFEDDSNFFKQLVASKSWVLEGKSKKCAIIVWLDKIDKDSCLLTIFPSAQESTFFNFPISAPVSRFPTKDASPPFQLSKFGIADCDYFLNFKKQ